MGLLFKKCHFFVELTIPLTQLRLILSTMRLHCGKSEGEP